MRRSPAAAVASPEAPRRRFRDRLFAPVDIGPLVLFRILFGALCVWEVALFFTHGLIDRYYISSVYHFTYYGFGWVRPWPGAGMYVHFAVLGVLAALLTVGLFTRLSAGLFCLGFTYVFLLEKARYMNHFYLMILVSGLLVFLPAGRAGSLDARFWPRSRSDTAPAWCLWLLRFQFGVVYFFAGLAKLHPDWLSGAVLTEMLSYKTDFPGLGSWFGERWLVLAFSYGALLFDLAVFPLLLWKKTRTAAVAVAVLFHLMNARLFNIDVFPWMMIGATVLLFLPVRLPRGSRHRMPERKDAVPGAEAAGSPRHRTLVATCLALYAAVQILVPLRHYAYPGDAAWTDEGQEFAWRMLMRVKVGQKPRFPVTCRLNGRRVKSEIPLPTDPDVWTRHWQARKLVIDPDLILQFCHLHADHLRRRGAEEIDIRAIVPVSLNGRPPQLLVDPEVNLAKTKRSLGPKPWIRPLNPSS